LKIVYSNTALALSPSLLGLPSAAVGFTINTQGVTALGVAALNSIFIYKNMRPFYKYTLPDLEVEEVEKDGKIF
jgi:Bardet-Biedl syndrome 1 protein